MKISYLHIRNYKQFSDLELDLTYPKGHKKAGEPLDKICIIGQSGVGKTNLLDIIKKSTIDFSEQPKNSYLPFSEFVGQDTDDRYITTKFKLLDQGMMETLFTVSTSELITDRSIKFLDNEKSYFIGANKNIIDNNINKIKNKVSSSLEVLKAKNFIDRNIININEENNSWKLLKTSINNYDVEKKEYENKLFKKVRKNPKDAEKTIEAMEKWEEENENILEKIADDINSIIQKFNLELQIDEHTESYEGLIIKDLSNNTIIEYDSLSTGTKKLLSTFIPLKSYKPKDSIILIDEPEMSFYPDIQRELVDLYTTVGENNQLVVATHSPLIASSFEPWEVVELKFDKDNQICREKYYEGDNHHDNYVIDPRMLTWTGILTDVFDLKEDSFSYREQKLMKYGMLKAEIKAMQKGIERDGKLKEFKKLSSLLGLAN